MAFFTLRRKGKKVHLKSPEELELPPGGTLRKSIFTSTPNLQKINFNNSSSDQYSQSNHLTVNSPNMVGTFTKKKLSTSQTPSLRNLFANISFGSNSNPSSVSSSTSTTPSLKKKQQVYAYNNSQHSAFDLRSNVQESLDHNQKHPADEPDPIIRSESTYTIRGNIEPGVISSSSSSSDIINNNSRENSSDRCDSSSITSEFQFKSSSQLAGGGFEEIREKVERTPEEMHRISEMLKGIKKFNMDPKKGIAYLVEQSIICENAEDVAHFLKEADGLSKTAIGNYLGEKIEFNEEVLGSFVKLHDFSGIILVQALRQFLWSFRLPGEAQKIDRMIEQFALHYCSLNQDIFSSTDTCYLLSYSIIMLNTLLHNSSVKDKPTEEKFIKMNRDIDCGQSLNPEFLSSLYNSILTEPFKIPHDEHNDLNLTFFNPDIEGWLWKLGDKYRIWKRRFFILNNNCLYYFKFTTDKTPRGIIPLENLKVREVPDKVSYKSHSFILFKESSKSSANTTEYVKSCKTLSDGQIIPGKHTVFHLASFNTKDRDKWIRAIEQNVSSSEFYSILAEKKRKMMELGLKSANSQSDTSTLGRRNKKQSQSQQGTVSRAGAIRKSQITLPKSDPTVPAHKDPNNYFNRTQIGTEFETESQHQLEPPDQVDFDILDRQLSNFSQDEIQNVLFQVPTILVVPNVSTNAKFEDNSEQFEDQVVQN